MKKKNNIRQCIITRKRLDKSQLIRFVIIDNNGIIDFEKKHPARGYWISKNLDIKAIDKERRIIKKLKNSNLFIDQLIKILIRSKHEEK